MKFLAPLLMLAASSSVWGTPTQVLLGLASGWDSPAGWLQRFERTGATWKPVGDPIRVLYGRAGLAWGRGLHGTDEPGLQKVERDRRAPAGVFAIGTIYTHDKTLPEGADYPFHTVTKGCAWIDDPHHPQYNQHVMVNPALPPAWFRKQRMRHGDAAYRWLIEIRHNADPPLSGAGSAIFFHIWRGSRTPSAGCTVMQESDLEQVVCWLRADSNPRYALLPRHEYLARWKNWHLPDPNSASALLACFD